MAARVTISYERPEELACVLRVLAPLIDRTRKIRATAGKDKRRAYVWVKKPEKS